ncbi:hypothetical protein, conserved [Cyanidioschyzon merolae strain 10D]|uniref:CobW C-terminal domain-containing protein n=1 Tax=Cyanidioschyzon merolae (strain NIES-3377 / 10D) TaxID=280699 RepID=M1VDL9_CYAM1|nr:hypothetical protein, conserved [Cyanidioschyzon merolae strain 10D]BAM80887.1 hypothetical protein, conserved [Cyanidioschyzon merolae strain 10D]|eukprot:XP_005536923.1 hypothetical protein, conserved [Cyanidioschyzon merolae strain 10D]
MEHLVRKHLEAPAVTQSIGSRRPVRGSALRGARMKVGFTSARRFAANEEDPKSTLMLPMFAPVLQGQVIYAGYLFPQERIVQKRTVLQWSSRVPRTLTPRHARGRAWEVRPIQHRPLTRSSFAAAPVAFNQRSLRRSLHHVALQRNTSTIFAVVLPAFQWSADVTDGGGSDPPDASAEAAAMGAAQRPPQQTSQPTQAAESDTQRRTLRSTPVPTVVLSGLDDIARLRLLGTLLEQLLQRSPQPEERPPRVGVLLPATLATRLGLVWDEDEAGWLVNASLCTESLPSSLCSALIGTHIYFEVLDNCVNQDELGPKIDQLMRRRARTPRASQAQSGSAVQSAADQTVEAAPSPVNLFQVQAAYGVDYLIVCSPEKEEPYAIADSLAHVEWPLQLLALVSVIDAAAAAEVFAPTLRQQETASVAYSPENTAQTSPASERIPTTATGITGGTGLEISHNDADQALATSDTVETSRDGSSPSRGTLLHEKKTASRVEAGDVGAGDNDGASARRPPAMERERGSASNAQADNLVQLLVDQIEYANLVVVYNQQQMPGRETDADVRPMRKSQDASPDPEVRTAPTPSFQNLLRYLRLLNCEAQVILMHANTEWPQTLLERILERPFDPERMLWMPTWRRVLASFAATELTKTSQKYGSALPENRAQSTGKSSAKAGPSVGTSTAAATPATRATVPETSAASASQETTAATASWGAASAPDAGYDPGKAAAPKGPGAATGGSATHPAAPAVSSAAGTARPIWDSRFSNEQFLATLYSGTRPWERGFSTETVRPETSFLYRANRPFHPRRLFDKISDISTFHGVLRSVGKLWLANRMDSFLEWSQVGNNITLKRGQRFLVTLPLEQWPSAPNSQDRMRPLQWDERFGDRCSEIVFLGEDLDAMRIQIVLDECLLRDEELVFTEAWSEFEDPFESLVPNTDSTRAGGKTPPAAQPPSFVERLSSRVAPPWILITGEAKRSEANSEQNERILVPGDVEPLPANEGILAVCGLPGAGKTSLVGALNAHEDLLAWRLEPPGPSTLLQRQRLEAVSEAALASRLESHPRPFRLALETDEPLDGVDAVVCAVDCLRFRSQDHIQQQLVASADTVVFTKSDVVPAERLQQILEHVCGWNPHARVICAPYGRLQPAAIWVRRRNRPWLREAEATTTTTTTTTTAPTHDADSRVLPRLTAQAMQDAAPAGDAHRPAAANRGRLFRRLHLQRTMPIDVAAFMDLLRALEPFTETLYAVGIMRPANAPSPLLLTLDGVYMRIESHAPASIASSLTMDLVLYADGIQAEDLGSFFDRVHAGTLTS